MRRRIILEYNEEAGQWEWEIQESTRDDSYWTDILGDDFAGQNEDFEEACESAREALMEK